MSESVHLDEIRRYYEASKISDWYQVDQEQINKFGQATGDEDWLHTDPERARKEAPFGGTIAFGFWTLSLLTHLGRQAAGQDYPDGASFAINYGFDRVRFVAPVLVGKRIRSCGRLMDITDRGDNRFLIKSEITVEIEGEEKPALVAEWLVMLFYPADAS